MNLFTIIAIVGCSVLFSGSAFADNSKLTKIGTVGKKTFFLQAAEDSHPSWEDAKTFCVQNGMKLASILNKEENDIIVKYILKLAQNGSNNYHGWLGGSDLAKEGVWEWVTGDAFVYTNWENAPIAGNKYDRCARISPNGKWAATYCDEGFGRPICQKTN